MVPCEDARKKAVSYVVRSGFFIASLVLPVVAQQSAATQQPEQPAANSLLATKNPEPISELPDSPGATLSKSEDAAKQQNNTDQAWSAAPTSPAQAQPQPAQSSGTGMQSSSQKPVGTAVAEAPNAGGVAASQPAGVAIAPAKQRRVRTIVLRMGAIVGAGVAIGSVVALTAATPSKPPGAH